MSTNVNIYLCTMTQTVCMTLWCLTGTSITCLGIQLSDLIILVRFPHTQIRQSVDSLREKSNWANSFVYNCSRKGLKQVLLLIQ